MAVQAGREGGGAPPGGGILSPFRPILNLRTYNFTVLHSHLPDTLLLSPARSYYPSSYSMSDDFFADLLPIKPKVAITSENLASGAKSPFDQNAALVSGLDNRHESHPMEVRSAQHRTHQITKDFIMSINVIHASVLSLQRLTHKEASFPITFNDELTEDS